MYDLLLGPSRCIQGGGVIKKLLTGHSNLLRTTFVRLKISAGAQRDEDLLPVELRAIGNMPRFSRINASRTTKEDVHDILKGEGYELQKEKYHKQEWSVNK